jgi:hypothetical protein
MPVCIRPYASIWFISAAIIYSQLITAQDKRFDLNENTLKVIEQRGEVVIRFTRPSGMELEYLTSFLSIDRVQHDTVTAYTNKQGFMRFLADHIPYELLQAPSLGKGLTARKWSAGDWHNQYPSYPGYISIMDSLARAYPELCRLNELATTVRGHKLLAMKISGHPEVCAGKPVVLLTSTIHGDEPVGYVLMLRLIETLLQRYEQDDRIRKLVDSTEIWINPLANPDGTYFLSDSSLVGATRFNANQVDLNRNFPDPVLGEHPDSYIWQDETVAMMNFMKGMPLVLAVNFHTGTEVVNYPWEAFARLHPDDEWYRRISRDYADTVHHYAPPGYMTALDNGITNGYQWYPLHGGRQDYVNYFLHGREVTIELSNDKIPPGSSLDNYWKYNGNSMLQFIGTVFTGIRGVVTDSVNGLPVRAMISLPGHDADNSQVYADPADGHFYRLLENGHYLISISANGYHTKNIPVTVVEGELTGLTVHMSPFAQFTLFPNPFDDMLQVQIDEAGNDVILEFTDLSGRNIKRIIQPVTVASLQEIAVRQLPAGLYIVHISYGNQVTRQIIMKK